MAKKIKNPEKYIESLKKKVKRLKHEIGLDRQRFDEYRGRRIASWTSGTEDRHDCYGNELGEFRLNDDVAVIGRIIEVGESYEKSGKAQSFIRFKRLYTKKVKRY